MAQEEELAIQQDRLESNKQHKEHIRQESLREAFAKWVNRLLILIFALIGLALLSVVFHHLAPVCWRWMPEDDVNTVSTVLFSGTLFVFLGLYVRDRV